MSDSNPVGGSSVTYTITVQNLDTNATTLNEIRDTLPPGFSYDCSPPPDDQLTLPGMAPQDIVPDGGPCPSGTDVDWSMPPGTSIESGDEVTLTFKAVTSLATGAYCNELQVVPGGNKTRSGQTAVVEIGTPAANPLCPGEAVLVTKAVDSVALVSTDASSVPFTYAFDVDFTIQVENIGTDDLTIKSFVDLLPVGFSYVSTSGFGDITAPPDDVLLVGGIDRQQVTWNGTDPVTIVDAVAPAIDELQAVVDADPGSPLADKAEDALQKLENGLNEYDSPDYVAAMGSFEGAAGDLQDAVDAGLFDPVQQAIDLMEYITGISRQIAEGTLAQTIADGGDPTDIANAQQALDDGDALRAAGSYKDAIATYKIGLGFLPFNAVDDFSSVLAVFKLDSGTSKTIKFSTTAVITRGNYRSDLLVNFGGGSFPEDRYSGPTALVSVKDVYSVTATDDTGQDLPVTLQVWVGGENGAIDTWGIR